MKDFFNIKKHNTSVKKEITAGITTFFSVVYVLMITANVFSNPLSDGSNPLGVSYGAVYIATAIASVIGTLVMGCVAGLPVTLSTGLGLSAFLVYTVCIENGFTYANAMALVFIDGVIFLILTLTGLRTKVFEAIPKAVREVTIVGIGLFIAFIGLQGSGIIVANDSTIVTLGSFNLLDSEWKNIMPSVVTIVSLVELIIMEIKNIKGGVLWAILSGTILYYLLGLTIPDFYVNTDFTLENPLVAFKDFATQSFGVVFKEGFDFSSFIKENGVMDLIVTILTTSLAFCMVYLFDTAGTLFGCISQGGLLDKEGNIPNMKRGMLADAVGAVTSAICGTSAVTPLAESTSGIVAGGRTGLTSVVTAVLLVFAMFFSPIAQLIPGCATAPALIYVGVLMMSSVKKVEWSRLELAVPAFMTIIMIPLSYNIAYGVAFGMITYVLLHSFMGKIKEVKISTWIVTVLFVVMLLFTH